MLEPEILQLGTIAVLFLFAIKEFFAFLKSKNEKQNGMQPDDIHQIKTDIALIQLQLVNHMTDYNKCITRTEKMVEENSNSINEIKETLVRIDAKLKQ